MKIKSKSLILVLIGLCLVTGCNNKNEDSIVSFNQSNSSVNTSVSTSSINTNSTVSLTWSSTDLNDMKTYLNSNYVLPFPNGFTSNYINCSGTDSDGDCFIVYDKNVGDLALSYSSQLEKESFEKDSKNSNDSVTVYYRDFDSITIYVQMGIENNNEFVIYAYYVSSSSYNESSDFPYSNIASYFGISEANSKTIVPSFDLKSNEKYQYYDSNNGVHFYIGGTIDGTNSNYTNEYESKLIDLGYSKSSDGVYINNALNYKISYMLTDDYFFVDIEKVTKSNPSDSQSIELTYSDFSTGYSLDEQDLIKGNYSFKYSSIMQSNEYIQFRSNASNKPGPGYIYNYSSLGKISSIVIEAYTTSYYGELSLYVGNSILTEVSTTKIEPVVLNNTYTYTVNGDYSYFLIKDESQQASKNNSILINYSI